MDLVPATPWADDIAVAGAVKADEPSPACSMMTMWVNSTWASHHMRVCPPAQRSGITRINHVGSSIARSAVRRASSTRDRMPSLANTCRRCELTVYGDR